MSLENVTIEDEVSIKLIKGKRMNKRKLLELFNFKRKKEKNYEK